MVQIVVGSQPSLWAWLGPVLLAGTSLLATGAAFLGVRKSNRTNRDAIDAADKRANKDRAESRDRDFRTWQRDVMLRVASEASEAAIEAHDLYFKVAHADQLNPESMEPIAHRSRIIGARAALLRMIGAHAAADRCADLRDAVNSEALARSLADYRKDRQSQLNRLMFEGNREKINIGRAALGETVERELRTLILPDSSIVPRWGI